MVTMSEDVERRRALEYSLAQRPELARRLLDDPAGVLHELGWAEDDLRCTPDAHAALTRATAQAEALTRLGAEASLIETLPKAATLLEEGLGEDFVTEKIPFGMRFRERVLPNTFIGTATVECTFGFSCHPDIDE